MKKIVWSHPKINFVMEMPDDVYELLSPHLRRERIKTKFVDNVYKLRGAEISTIIIDEYIKGDK